MSPIDEGECKFKIQNNRSKPLLKYMPWDLNKDPSLKEKLVLSIFNFVSQKFASIKKSNVFIKGPSNMPFTINTFNRDFT